MYGLNTNNYEWMRKQKGLHRLEITKMENHFRTPIRYKENGEINAGIVDKESTRKIKWY